MNFTQVGIKVAKNLRRSLGLTISEIGGCKKLKIKIQYFYNKNIKIENKQRQINLFFF